MVRSLPRKSEAAASATPASPCHCDGFDRDCRLGECHQAFLKTIELPRGMLPRLDRSPQTLTDSWEVCSVVKRRVFECGDDVRTTTVVKTVVNSVPDSEA